MNFEYIEIVNILEMGSKNSLPTPKIWVWGNHFLHKSKRYEGELSDYKRKAMVGSNGKMKRYMNE